MRHAYSLGRDRVASMGPGFRVPETSGGGNTSGGGTEAGTRPGVPASAPLPPPRVVLDPLTALALAGRGVRGIAF